MSDIKTEIQAHLAAEEQNVKSWFEANRAEAYSLLAVAFTVGLMLGALIGYLMRGHS